MIKMPKGQSDTKPNSQIKSRGKTQVLYNILQKDVTDAQTGAPRTIWEYDYVEIVGIVTKQKIVEALQKADAELDETTIVPDDISTQYQYSKSELALSEISHITYAQLDTYIQNNITDLASAKTYLKKLSRVVLALVKKYND